MNVVSVFGSPRKNGNTAIALGWMEDVLRENGHNVERINIANYELKGCVSCYKCQMNTEEYRCIQKDDANDLYERVRNADAVVIASPLYWWSFSSQLKPFWDRLLCQMKGMHHNQRSTLKDIPFSLLMTCMGPVENNSEPAVDMYRRSIKLLLAVDRGSIVVPGCLPNGSVGEEYKNPIRDLALKLVEQSLPKKDSALAGLHPSGGKESESSDTRSANPADR